MIWKPGRLKICCQVYSINMLIIFRSLITALSEQTGCQRAKRQGLQGDRSNPTGQRGSLPPGDRQDASANERKLQTTGRNRGHSWIYSVTLVIQECGLRVVTTWLTNKYGNARMAQRNNMTKKIRQDTIDCIDIEYHCVPIFSLVADMICEGDFLRSLLDAPISCANTIVTRLLWTLDVILIIHDGSGNYTDERLRLT